MLSNLVQGPRLWHAGSSQESGMHTCERERVASRHVVGDEASTRRGTPGEPRQKLDQVRRTGESNSSLDPSRSRIRNDRAVVFKITTWWGYLMRRALTDSYSSTTWPRRAESAASQLSRPGKLSLDMQGRRGARITHHFWYKLIDGRGTK